MVLVLALCFDKRPTHLIVIFFFIMSAAASSSVLLRRSVSIASWNVNGIRSFLKHDEIKPVLKEFIQRRKVDILCLQETKLQEGDVPKLDKLLSERTGAKHIAWSSSRGRKGYSGTAILSFCDDIQPDAITYGIHDEEGDIEGRSITYESPHFSLVNVYVPNAGAELKRLSYRTDTWDASLSKYIASLRAKNPDRPVILTGDLNVAHTDLDFYNYRDPRAKTQAGTTPQEKLSFENKFLRSLGMVDTFRIYHPGQRRYSYFSSRKGHKGREQREGWRLDYVLTDIPAGKILSSSSDCMPYIEEKLNHPHSDHCPVGMVFDMNCFKKQ